MIPSKKLSALLTLVYLNVVLFGNSRVSGSPQDFYKNQKFSKSITSGSLHESVASYALCHDIETSSDGKYSRKCNIVHGRLNESKDLSTCEIAFQGKFTDDYTLHALSADKMVIVWYDDNDENPENLLRYTFIHLPDCQTAEATVVFDDRATLSTAVNNYGEAIIFNEDGTYDVFFKNPKFCGEKVCRLTINSQGKTVKGPTASFVPSDNPIVLTEPTPVNNSIGIAELGIDSEKTKVSLITPDGSVKVLREFPNGDWTDNDVSITQGMIRGCSYKGDDKVECEVFDANGQSLSKSFVDLGDQEYEKLGLSNLPNGEFIVLTELEHGRHSNITKFDADNKRIGTVQLPEFPCKESMTDVKEVYKEDNKNCIARMCYDSRHIDLANNCFDDEDFK